MEVIVCRGHHGGAGTSVVAGAMACELARAGRQVLLVDLAGVQPTLLGIEPPLGPGLAGWLAAGPGVAPDGLARIEVEVGDGLGLLPRGDGPLDPDRAAVLAALLERERRTVVVDAGLAGAGSAAGVVASVGAPTLVIARACPVALASGALARRGAGGGGAVPMEAPVVAAVVGGRRLDPVSGLVVDAADERSTVVDDGFAAAVLVRDPGRSLGVRPAAEVLGCRVVAEIGLDPAIGAAVDRGLLHARLPRRFAAVLRALAEVA